MATPTVTGTSSSAHTTGTLVASLSWTHTVPGTGQNTMLIVGVLNNNGNSATAVDWDDGGANTALTLLWTAASSAIGQLETYWYLANPVTGTKTIKVTFGAGNSLAFCWAMNLQDAKQTSPLDGNNVNTGTSITSLATNLTTGTDNSLAIVFNVSSGATTPNYVDNGSQTRQITDNDGASNQHIAVSTLPITTAGTNSLGYTWTGARNADNDVFGILFAPPGPAGVKTWDGITQSTGIKTYQGVALASVKSWNGIT